MPRLARAILPLVLPAALTLSAADLLYRSALVDDKGWLHITLESGKEIIPPKSKGQASFGDAWISQDGRTVGWLVMYPYPEPEQAWRGPIAGALVIYRAGHLVRTFPAEQPIWAWQFQDGGKRVAYATGGMQGGVQSCLLRDVDSGRIVAGWSRESGSEPPHWANLCQ